MTVPHETSLLLPLYEKQVDVTEAVESETGYLQCQAAARNVLLRLEPSNNEEASVIAAETVEHMHPTICDLAITAMKGHARMIPDPPEPAPYEPTGMFPGIWNELVRFVEVPNEGAMIAADFRLMAARYLEKYQSLMKKHSLFDDDSPEAESGDSSQDPSSATLSVMPNPELPDEITDAKLQNQIVAHGFESNGLYCGVSHMVPNLKIPDEDTGAAMHNSSAIDSSRSRNFRGISRQGSSHDYAVYRKGKVVKLKGKWVYIRWKGQGLGRLRSFLPDWLRGTVVR